MCDRYYVLQYTVVESGDSCVTVASIAEASRQNNGIPMPNGKLIHKSPNKSANKTQDTRCQVNKKHLPHKHAQSVMEHTGVIDAFTTNIKHT